MGIWDEYIQWIAVGKLKFTLQEFSKLNPLIWTLVDIPYSYIHPMDENRRNDALSLRSEFERTTECSLEFLDSVPKEPSVFEVLAALACRLENQLMRDVSLGDRSKVWFLEMLKNLDILRWDFDHLQYNYKEDVAAKVQVWLQRKYDKDGKGGLFPLKHPSTNQVNEQLWNQAMAYLTENWLDDLTGLELFN